MADPVASTPASVEPDAGRDSGARGQVSRWQKGVGAIGLIVVLWVGYDSTLVRAWSDDEPTMDHMPDGMDHGPVGDAPTGEIEDGDDAPPDDGQGDHDPGQWDH